ncbi:efflux RND transporter periplasmic adaptor subunit [Microbulbifer sp. JMSA004]|uniref:efflux RND transporter periplasmic adaptor subunit n=1 Tax=unclassified Microbulbifer TaxID=2619833 RepID=UPI0024AE65FD|nr:HlyD family efflux transporter periplasmic adaptor subunit [Microbulbifer sp. VAAF005]WHI44686.1 HlyD family efflux transporter periplasmic adaptor subunit [Microbulbifer sp. VAAF005]
MDEVIQRRKLPLKKATIVIGALILVALIVVSISGNPASIEVDTKRLVISQVEEKIFSEYIPVIGTVTPQTTVYLDLQEGGIVKEIYIQGGTLVQKGDVILQLANASAQKSNVDSESQALRTLNDLRTQKINLTQQYLQSKENLLDLNKQLLDAQRLFSKLTKLYENDGANITQNEYEEARDMVLYLKKKIELKEERIKQENTLRLQQEEQIDDSIKRSNRSLIILSDIMNSLEVRAPISGQLSSMNAEIGQSFNRGQRVGQVDKLDHFKVRVKIDQYYISRVSENQSGHFKFNGKNHEVILSKIYPEVIDNQFIADMDFIDGFPIGIKRGQTLSIDLELGNASTTKTLKKGGFYRYTSGKWVYRVLEDGSGAKKVKITPGRQNPQTFEILNGLSAGDKIITTNYEDFGDADEITFKSPIQG